MSKEQRPRQLAAYRSKRPSHTEEYKEGVKSAVYSIRNDVQVECPHHIESGRWSRWQLGFSDEMLRLARHYKYLVIFKKK